MSTEIRLKVVESRAKGSNLREVTGSGASRALEIWRGNGVTLKVGLYRDETTPLDIADMASVKVQFQEERDSTEAFAVETVLAAGFEATAIAHADFEAGTDWHIEVTFSNAEMNPTLPTGATEGNFWCVVYGADLSGNERTFGAGLVRFVEDGSAADPGAPPGGGVAMVNPMTSVGDLIRGGSGGLATRLAAGTNGYVMAMVAGVPTWVAASTVAMVNPMTTSGDIIVGGASGAPTRLAAGAANRVFGTNPDGAPGYHAMGGGPVGSVDISTSGSVNTSAVQGRLIKFAAASAAIDYELDSSAGAGVFFWVAKVAGPEAVNLTAGSGAEINGSTSPLTLTANRLYYVAAVASGDYWVI